MYSTGRSSLVSRFAVYLVAGCELGDMESNVRFRELVMVSDATETTRNSQYAACEVLE
jgi:hypothetical protein